MLHEKVGKDGTRNRGRYQVAQTLKSIQSTLSHLQSPPNLTSDCIKIWKISKHQQNNKCLYSCVTPLLGNKVSFLFQFIKPGKSLID